MVSTTCVCAGLTLRDGNVLQQENDSSHRKFARHSRYELAVNDRRAHMLKTARHVLKNLDRVVPFRISTMTH